MISPPDILLLKETLEMFFTVLPRVHAWLKSCGCVRHIFTDDGKAKKRNITKSHTENKAKAHFWCERRKKKINIHLFEFSK